MPGGRNALREALKSCFQRHSRHPLTWHAWGRLGAAAFVRLGGTVANLTAWARWRSQQQARHYAKNPPKWDFSDSIVLPLPKKFTGSPSEDLELLGPLSCVLNGIRWKLDQGSPLRDPKQWTAIPLGTTNPQSGMGGGGVPTDSGSCTGGPGHPHHD